MSSEFRIENSTGTTPISNCSMLTCERDCVRACVRVLQYAEYKCAPRTRMLSRSSLDGKVNPFVQAHRGIMEFDEHILCRQLAARSRHGVASDGACFELAVALRARQIGLVDGDPALVALDLAQYRFNFLVHGQRQRPVTPC